MNVCLTALAVALTNPVEFSTYICLDNTVFTLSTSDEMAIVHFKDGEYRLPRRRSALAIKYATEDATLYLDGQFAAFAPTTDHFQVVTNWNLASVDLLDADRIACGYPPPIADIGLLRCTLCNDPAKSGFTH